MMYTEKIRRMQSQSYVSLLVCTANCKRRLKKSSSRVNNLKLDTSGQLIAIKEIIRRRDTDTVSCEVKVEEIANRSER